MGLLSSGDIAGKQNHACGLNLREQGSEAWRHLGPVEADDEELADIHPHGLKPLTKIQVAEPRVTAQRNWNIARIAKVLPMATKPSRMRAVAMPGAKRTTATATKPTGRWRTHHKTGSGVAGRDFLLLITSWRQDSNSRPTARSLAAAELLS